MELNTFKQYKTDNSTKLVRTMEIKAAARLIRIHNKIHFAAEPNALIISQILESCAQILELIAERKIRYERYGRWIPVPQTDITKDWVCSNCQGVITVAHFCKECYYDYCPHCGAKMREEQNENCKIEN